MTIDKEKLDRISEFMSNGEFNEAISLINPILEEYPNNIILMLDLAYSFANLSRFEEAIKLYSKIIELAPENSSGYTGLGFIYRKQGKNEAAIKEFTKGILYAPDNAIAHFEKAEALFEIDEYEESLKSYYKALQFSGAETEAETLHRIAQVNLGLKNYDKAIKIGNDVLTRDPSYVSINNIIALAYYLKEDWKNAELHFEKYLKVIPEDESASNLLHKIKEILKEIE
ncbi:tetratricopeptide repeat protein [Promethearchaeum syntrophicum]|uniref:Tetratricopeptide repeat protein n=1 Tax=Promethearchaeum syntrophicum TaxID=2594042 RepID=A0A5B9D8F5_9ARCH|nr:tetratricopeptide repeat protein [Candidatus Prometheoarchaeum syntrophicum]QEE15343.1 photosystem I assembly protein Ycf3 [Candidatus Prometheoarchaeum syntrophicum]